MEVKANGIIEKASKLAEGEVEFVVSTSAWDSHGERINVDGINVKDFQKNPVVLWGHDGFNLPIATATKVWKDAGKLMARAKFFMDDAFSAKIYDYLVKGRLNAVSIGGMVQEWASDGLTIEKLNMKEFSVVSVPANPEALAVAKSLSGEQLAELRGLANAYARKVLDQNDGISKLKKEVGVLDTLVATLKELTNGETAGETHDALAGETNSRKVVLRQSQVVVQQAEQVIKTIKLEKGFKNNE
jgi:HK97 family phage prohead protease